MLRSFLRWIGLDDWGNPEDSPNARHTWTTLHESVVQQNPHGGWQPIEATRRLVVAMKRLHIATVLLSGVLIALTFGIFVLAAATFLRR